jgi:hypothetical protein
MTKPNGKSIGLLILTILTSPWLIEPVAFGQTRDIALITQPEGDVRVKRGRRRAQRIREDELLNIGDGIKINGEGTAVIYQAYVPITRLSTNGQFLVMRRVPPPPVPEDALTPKQFTTLKSNYLSARLNRNKPSPAIMGGPEDAILTLLEPRNSIVLSERPIFKWSRVANATKYVLNFYRRNESLICTDSTDKTELVLPDRCGLLIPGDYKWDVTAQIDNQPSDNPALYDATSFTVVSRRRAKEIDEELNQVRRLSATNSDDTTLVEAATLIAYELYPKAEVELRLALTRSPANQSLWTLLMETYAKMNRWRTREKARRISKGNPTVELIHTLEIPR